MVTIFFGEGLEQVEIKLDRPIPFRNRTLPAARFVTQKRCPSLRNVLSANREVRQLVRNRSA
jgi:hypothetical protein